MAVLPREMELARFLELPEQKPALEYEDGRITQKASPRSQHGLIQAGLAELFGQFARPRKIAVTFTELRATSGRRSYVPDLSIVRWPRLTVDASGEITNEFSDIPDLAIEIVSPDQSVTALVRHCLWYVANGAAVALLIDPADKSVLSFRPNQVTGSLADSDRIELDDVLPGFELTVQQVFDLLRLD